jgi:hypothetical protein
MLCPECHGKRGLWELTVMGMWYFAPCPYCDGLGEVSCCEGSERNGQLENEKDV